MASIIYIVTTISCRISTKIDENALKLKKKCCEFILHSIFVPYSSSTQACTHTKNCLLSIISSSTQPDKNINITLKRFIFYPYTICKRKKKTYLRRLWSWRTRSTIFTRDAISNMPTDKITATCYTFTWCSLFSAFSFGHFYFSRYLVNFLLYLHMIKLIWFPALSRTWLSGDRLQCYSILCNPIYSEMLRKSCSTCL